jgi:hypothetical protein
VIEGDRAGEEQVQDEQTDFGDEFPFEAFGVKLAIRANRTELLDHVPAVLPPGWRPCESKDVTRRFAIIADPTGTFGIAKDGKALGRGVELELALELLDSQIRLEIGERAPDRIFIHAGVVASGDQAIVIPGKSFAGKTELTAALVRQGAVYLSDEFAVLDEEGLVHPYPKPLSIRGDDLWQTHHDVESLGGTAGDRALPVGLIVVTSYRADAVWQPRRVSAGEGAMALLANAVPARERPAECMRAISRAARDAVILQGDRGEADAVASELLAELSGSPA